MQTKITRALQLWSFDLFELLIIGVVLYGFAIALGAYDRPQAHPAPVHKIETRAPEYAHPKRVKVAKLEQGDVD